MSRLHNAARAMATVLGLLAPAASAQDLSVLAGTNRLDTYAWSIDYRQSPAKYFAWSMAWINEGHVESHHRDGPAAVLWGTAPVPWLPQLEAAAGVGAYYFHDTQPLPDGGSKNAHGWSPIYDVALTYPRRGLWYGRLLYSHIAADPSSDSLLAGLGLRLGEIDNEESPAEHSRGARSQVTAYVGRTVVNTLESETATAIALEYRRSLGRHADWTVTGFDEGDTGTTHRAGLAAQIWLADPAPAQRVWIGIGVGPYAYRDWADDSDLRMSILVSPSAAIRFTGHWSVRLTWNRVISNYDRDADILLFGVGYRWQHVGP